MIRVILFTIILGVVFTANDDVQDVIKSPKKASSSNIYEYEKIFEQMIYKINRLNQELKYVKDEQTAKKASANISRLLDQLATLDKKIQKIGIPSSEDMQKIEKKYGDRMKSAIGGFSNTVMQLEKKEYASEILRLINPASK